MVSTAEVKTKDQKAHRTLHPKEKRCRMSRRMAKWGEVNENKQKGRVLSSLNSPLPSFTQFSSYLDAWFPSFFFSSEHGPLQRSGLFCHNLPKPLHQNTMWETQTENHTQRGIGKVITAHVGGPFTPIIVKRPHKSLSCFGFSLHTSLSAHKNNEGNPPSRWESRHRWKDFCYRFLLIFPSIRELVTQWEDNILFKSIYETHLIPAFQQ